MRRRFALVFNSRAGVAYPRLLDGVLRRLKAASADVFQVAARSASEAADKVNAIALRGEAEAVIAAGGDGTFRAVATGAGDTGLPVGVLPLGTGNIIAHEIGLARRPGVIAYVLHSGPVIDAQGGRVNGEPYFLMVGAGFDARIVQHLNYRTKRVLGRAAFGAPFIRTLLEAAPAFDVEIDGQAYRAGWVIASLAGRYGGALRLTNETAIGRERLTVTLFEPCSRSKMLVHAGALALGKLADARRSPSGIRVLAAERVRIGVQAPVAAQIDGDAAGIASLDITSKGPSVRLIVPPAYVADVTKRHANRLS